MFASCKKPLSINDAEKDAKHRRGRTFRNRKSKTERHWTYCDCALRDLLLFGLRACRHSRNLLATGGNIFWVNMAPPRSVCISPQRKPARRIVAGLLPKIRTGGRELACVSRPQHEPDTMPNGELRTSMLLSRKNGVSYTALFDEMPLPETDSRQLATGNCIP